MDTIRNRFEEETKHYDKIIEERSEPVEDQETEVGGLEKSEKQKELEEQILEKKVKIVILFSSTFYCLFISHPFFNFNKI